MKPHQPVKVFLIAFIGCSLLLLIFYYAIPEYNFGERTNALYRAGKSTPETVYFKGFSNLIVFKRAALYTILYWLVCLTFYLLSFVRRKVLSKRGVYLHLLFSLAGVVLFIFLNPFIVTPQRADVLDLYVTGDPSSADWSAVNRKLVLQFSTSNLAAVLGIICFGLGITTAIWNLKKVIKETR